MTPLYRFTPYLLLALICANVLFYAWFADRTRQTSADEIIQKAYIISRLLSDSAGRSIAGDDLNALDSSVAETFKDRHIVSVSILDRKGKVLFESATNRTAVRLSTFETPVKFANKNVGTLITRFSTGEEDDGITSLLRNTAALQLGLFAAIAAMLALILLRERISRRAAETRAAPSFPQTQCQTPWIISQESGAVLAGMEVISDINLPTEVISHSFADEPFRELFSACSSLQKAAELLSTESNHHQLAMKHSRQYLEQIGDWQQQTLQAADRADLLIATGGDIITQVNEQSSATTEAGQKLPGEMQLLKDRLFDVMAVVEKADDLVTRIGMELAAAPLGDRACDPDSSVAAASDMVHEGVAIIKGRAFPAITAALTANDNIAGRLSLLLKKIDEFGDNSCDLALYGEELFDLAEATRLLRRRRATNKDPVEEREEMGLNLLADRLEALAVTMKKETQSLLGAANEAAAIGSWTMADFDASRVMLVRTGDAVEDAAAATIVGGNFLRRAVRQFEDGAETRTAADVLTSLAKQLHQIRQPFAGEVNAVTNLVTQNDRQTAEYAQSLEVARGNLRLALKYLADIASDTARMAAANEVTASFHDESRPAAANVAIEQLIGEACACLQQLLQPRNSHKNAKIED